MRAFLERQAQSLADLALVSPSQWLLRGIAALSVLGAFLLVALRDGQVGWPAQMTGLLLVCLLIAATIHPDGDWGAGALGCVVLVAWIDGGQAWWPLAVAGGLLLAAHALWALAACLPAHGVVRRGGVRLWGGWNLLVIALSAVVLAVVAGPLRQLSVPDWMILIGVIAAIGLYFLLTPLQRRWRASRG